MSVRSAGALPQISTRGESVDVELQPSVGSSAAGRAARLPVDDLPGAVGLAEDRVDASADRELAEAQQERAARRRAARRRRTGCARNDSRSRSTRPGSPASSSSVRSGTSSSSSSCALAAGAALDPGVDLGADARRRAAEARQRAHARPVEALRALHVRDQVARADRLGRALGARDRPRPPRARAGARRAGAGRP